MQKNKILDDVFWRNNGLKFFLYKTPRDRMRESLNEVCEGVVRVKNYTKESCLP